MISENHRDHVAIMNKKWHLIEKILSGEKTIESRWYKNRVNPWNNINSGDTVYFKNSGEKISAKANVSKVLQFENLNSEKIKETVKIYGKEICLQDTNFENWGKEINYCILIFLENPQKVEPEFAINKKGFGSSCAWITVPDITQITFR